MFKFRNVDIKKPDGCYVWFERITKHDDDSDPMDYLFQDPDYREEDQARLDAFKDGAWSFIGIQAKAHILVVLNGIGTVYELTSSGVWSIEDDSAEEYLTEVFSEQCKELLAHMKMFANITVENT